MYDVDTTLIECSACETEQECIATREFDEDGRSYAVWTCADEDACTARTSE